MAETSTATINSAADEAVNDKTPLSDGAKKTSLTTVDLPPLSGTDTELDKSLSQFGLISHLTKTTVRELHMGVIAYKHMVSGQIFDAERDPKRSPDPSQVARNEALIALWDDLSAVQLRVKQLYKKALKLKDRHDPSTDKSETAQSYIDKRMELISEWCTGINQAIQPVVMAAQNRVRKDHLGLVQKAGIADTQQSKAIADAYTLGVELRRRTSEALPTLRVLSDDNIAAIAGATKKLADVLKDIEPVELKAVSIGNRKSVPGEDPFQWIKDLILK